MDGKSLEGEAFDSIKDNLHLLIMGMYCVVVEEGGRGVVIQKEFQVVLIAWLLLSRNLFELSGGN